MIVDLVRLTTRDGLRLDGALQAPAAGPRGELGVDACLLVHGTGGSFYSSTLFDSFAERFVQLGCAVLRVNTRGHDLISTAATAQGGRRLGAAYEVVDDCRHDLAGWIDWLGQRGYARIGLVGHSSGAVKAVYALAHESHAAVARLVALSPPRLSYSHFLASPEAPQFLEHYRAAERLVAAGQAAALMEVKQPLPFVVTAGGYLEKYGPDERYNLLKFIERVPCPTLVTFGNLELADNMAFRGLPAALAPLATRHGRMRIDIIDDGDHFYTRVREAVVARVESWLKSDPAAAGDSHDH